MSHQPPHCQPHRECGHKDIWIARFCPSGLPISTRSLYPPSTVASDQRRATQAYSRQKAVIIDHVNHLAANSSSRDLIRAAKRHIAVVQIRHCGFSSSETPAWIAGIGVALFKRRRAFGNEEALRAIGVLLRQAHLLLRRVCEEREQTGPEAMSAAWLGPLLRYQRLGVA